MQRKAYRSLSVRIDQQTYEKLSQIAAQEGRTRSRQALYWIRRALEAWEKQKDRP